MQTPGLGGGLETSGLGLCFLARAFRSCFSWFVLLGSCFWSFFWFVLLGARMCFLFDALKVLEACVARSEVS